MSFRTRARELAMQGLYQNEVQGTWDKPEDFAWLDFDPHQKITAFARVLIEGTAEHLPEIDQHIGRVLKHWDMDRVGGVEKAILRLSVYSLLYQPDIPDSVVMDEAVELAKTFCEDQSFSFINGVLDAIAQQIQQVH